MLAFSPKGFVSFSKEKAFLFTVIPWQELNLKAHEMRVLLWPELLPVLFWPVCFICSGEDLPHSFPAFVAPTKQILMESLTGFRSSALFLPAIKSNLLGLWLCQICQGGNKRRARNDEEKWQFLICALINWFCKGGAAANCDLRMLPNAAVTLN